MKTNRFRTTSILTLSLAWTGLACYLFSIIRGLGKDTALPFFDPGDIFSDFFKLIASYPGRHEIQLESWLPGLFSNIINGYLNSNPYSNNPDASISSLTNFHLTPVTQIINVTTRYLFDKVGPGMSLGIHFGIIFVFIGYLVSIASRRRPLSIQAILLSGCCIILYPSIFTILRGYSIAYLVNLLVCCSFLIAVRPNSPPWLPVFILSLAIGIRPNYILFLPLVITVNFCLRPIHAKASQVARAGVVTILSLFAAFLLATTLYKNYTINTFLNAYKFYSNAYEYDGTDNFWSSSLLQPLLILNKILAKITGIQIILPYQLKLICLGLSLVICLWSCIQLYKRKISFSKAILACCLGIILGTPVFADYHLLILLAPVFVSIYCERNVYYDLKESNDTIIASQSEELGLKTPRLYYQILSKTDGFIIIFLIVPKVLPIAVNLGSMQTFLNPLAICIYLYLTIHKPMLKSLKTNNAINKLQ